VITDGVHVPDVTQSDDERFAEVMRNFDRVHAEAVRKKREREAAEEVQRSADARRRRGAYGFQADSTPGRMMALAADGKEWTIEEFVRVLDCPSNRVMQGAYTLVGRGLLVRVRLGVYRASS
jgi:hypothetical protein